MDMTRPRGEINDGDENGKGGMETVPSPNPLPQSDCGRGQNFLGHVPRAAFEDELALG